MATNYENKFYKDYEKLQNKYDKKCIDYKHMELRAIIAEDTQMRLEKTIAKQENTISELKDENQKLQREIERLKSLSNTDGTNSGIPTSQTPIGKKKHIPNSRVKTGEKIGRKIGHKKDKLEKIEDEKINETVEHT